MGMGFCCCDQPAPPSSSSMIIQSSSSAVPMISGCGCNNKVPAVLTVSAIVETPTLQFGTPPQNVDLCDDIKLLPAAYIIANTSTLNHVSGCLWVGPCIYATFYDCRVTGTGTTPGGTPFNKYDCGSVNLSGSYFGRMRATVSGTGIAIGVERYSSEENCIDRISPTVLTAPSAIGFFITSSSFACDPNPFVYTASGNATLTCIASDFIPNLPFPQTVLDCGSCSSYTAPMTLSITG